MNLMKNERLFKRLENRAIITALLMFLPLSFSLLTAQVSVNITKVDPSCAGFTNGSASATASGGTTPYRYLWSNGSTASTLFGLGAGTYTVTATDAQGRTATATTTITPPAPINIATNFADVCRGGAVTATASGGTGPYTYNWGGGRTGATQTNLPSGGYSVTVTDSRGCQAIKFVVVPAPFTVGINVGELVCFGDCDAAIDALPTGGTAPYTYRWNTGATTQSIVGLPSGTYSVTVTDANGCTGTASGTVINPPIINVTTTVNGPACGGSATGSATANATGGRPPFTYRWSNGQNGATATGLSVGDYFVTATDSKGCNKTVRVTIPTNAGFTISIAKTDATCAGNNGSATANVTGGGRAPFTYNWSNGRTTQTISNIGAGNYTVTVTDANGCSNTATTTINAAGNLSISVSKTNAACGIANGTATVAILTGTAPYTYRWSNGATTQSISLLAAGTYTVTVTDGAGCTAIGSAEIGSSTSVAVTIEARNVTCFGATDGQATAMVSGGSAPYTYRWSNNGTVAVQANLGAGTYTVTVTDAAGCTGTASVTITQPPLLTVATSMTSTTCGASNGTATATVSGGTAPYTYVWSNGGATSTISNITAGTYTVTVTDARGCRTNGSITVTASAGAITVVINVNNARCYNVANGSATAVPSGGTAPYTYVWSNGATTATISNILAGSYTVTVTDANACRATQTATVSQPATAISIALVSTNTSCNTSNGTITTTVNGGTPQYSYLWSNGATTASLSGLSAGTYTLTVTDANGCTMTASASVGVANGPNIMTSSRNVSCFGANDGTASVTVTGGSTPYTYAWSNSRTTASISGLSPGSYSVTVTDASGCRAIGTITIAQPAALSLAFSTTNATCLPTGSATVTASGGTTPYTYLWSNNRTTATISGINGGDYSVTVTDANGCQRSGSVTVTAITPANLACSVNITSHVTILNGSNGAANVTASGGQAPYTYLWSTGATTQAVSNLSPGLISVTITDANGCKTACGGTILNSACPNVTNPGTICCSQAFCAPDYTNLQDITQTTAATGGSGTLEYMWMYSDISENFDRGIWNTIPNATGANLPKSLFPSNITRKTWFIRCVRRAGCSDWLESNIVSITPTASADWTVRSLICTNQDVTFTAPDNGPNARYNWTFAGANVSSSTERQVTVRFASFGTKNISLNVQVGFGINLCTANRTGSVQVLQCTSPFGGIMGVNVNALSVKEAMIDWVTEKEVQPSRYIVERSFDGVNFESIGQVGSQNRANNVYRFSDMAPKRGRSFYRIRQIDLNEEVVTVTDAKKLVMAVTGQKLLTYPNPAQNVMYVELLEDENTEGVIEIYDSRGSLVRTKNFAGNQSRIEIETSSLSQGFYILKVRSKQGEVRTERFTRQ